MSPKMSNLLTLGDRFFSYAEFKSALRAYEIETDYKYIVYKTTKLSAIRVRFPTSYANADANLKYYKIHLICDKQRIVEKQTTTNIGCTASIRLALSKDGQSLFLWQIDETHNHAHLKPGKKKSVAPPEVEQQQIAVQQKTFLVHEINEFAILEGATGNSAASEVSGLFYENEMMKTMFAAFPEILIIDGTFNHSQLGMRLYVFSIIDGNGQSEVVSLAPIGVETDDMIILFKNMNPSWKSIRTIIIDDEFGGVKDLKDHFVDAEVRRYPLNIRATFEGDVTTEKLGITELEREVCLTLLDALIRSKNEKEYKQNHLDLLATRIENVVSYYEKWHDGRFGWVCKLKKGSAIYTKSLLELQKTFAKVCEKRSKKTPLKDFLAGLKMAVKKLRRIKDKKASKFDGKIQMSSSYANGSVESQYSNLLTPYAFTKLLCREMAKRDKVAFTVDSTPDTAFFLTKTGRQTAHINTCDCEFHTAYGLPCRHILACCKYKKYDEYQPALVAARWLRSYYKKRHCALSYDSTLTEVEDQSVFLRQLVQYDRFKVAKNVAVELAGLISESPSEPEFQLRIELLKLIKRAFAF